MKDEETYTKTYRHRGDILAIDIWVGQEGVEDEATGSRLDSDCNGKGDALLGIDNERIQNEHTAYFL